MIPLFLVRFLKRTTVAAYTPCLSWPLHDWVFRAQRPPRSRPKRPDFSHEPCDRSRQCQNLHSKDLDPWSRKRWSHRGPVKKTPTTMPHKADDNTKDGHSGSSRTENTRRSNEKKVSRTFPLNESKRHRENCFSLGHTRSRRGTSTTSRQLCLPRVNSRDYLLLHC